MADDLTTFRFAVSAQCSTCRREFITEGPYYTICPYCHGPLTVTSCAMPDLPPATILKPIERKTE